MKIFNTDKLPKFMDDKLAQSIYNGLDSLLTEELYGKLRTQLRNETAGTYDFERKLLGPYLTMVRRGILIDEAEKNRLVEGDEGLQASSFRLSGMERVVKNRKATWKISNENALLQRLARIVWGKGLNYHSDKQLKEFFYGFLAIPEITVVKKGERKVSCDREALEKMKAAYTRAIPFCNIILRIRDLEKQIDILTKGLAPGHRWAAGYNIGGTDTGRRSSSDNPLRHSCVDGDTEILSPVGWIKISNFIAGDVAQWRDGKIIFAPASQVNFDFNGKLNRVKTSQVEVLATDNHRTLYRTPGNRRAWRESTIGDIQKAYLHLPVSGIYDGVNPLNLNEPKLRLTIAALADGGLDNCRHIKFSFKKRRKADRLRQLAKQAGVRLYEWKHHDPEYICLGLRIESTYTEVIKNAWGPWVLGLSKELLSVCVDEARYWDGHLRNKSYLFYTAKLDEADWFSTACHLAGHSVTWRTVNNFGGYNKNPEAILNYVNVKPRDYVSIEAKHWSKVGYVGKVYCLTTKTGYFLIRKNRHISITGNSNVQNIDPGLRRVFVADLGYTLVQCDQQGADARVVAYKSGDENYIKAVESGDSHTIVCGLTWGFEPKRELADRLFYRDKTYRDMAKKLGHGSNYFGKPKTVGANAKVPTKLAEEFQERYFGAFPGIREWQEWVISEIQTKGFLTTATGRKRQFWGRLNDEATWRAAISYEPQSVVGDLTAMGIYNLWYHFEPTGVLQILADGHDAVLMQIKTEALARVLPSVLQCLNVPIPVTDIHGTTRFMTIPWVPAIGKNWGKFSADNPNGLKEQK